MATGDIATGSGTGGQTGNGPAAANFSNAYQTIQADDSSQSHADVQVGNAPVISAGEGSSVTVNGSDYGALAAAQSLVSQAVDLSKFAVGDTLGVASEAIRQGTDTVQKQGAGALALITKPFIWIAAIVAGTAILIFFLWKKGKHHGQ